MATSAGPGAVAIVHGEVGHARARPRPHAFAYDAFCLCLPLDRLDSLARVGIAHNRAGLVSFYDRDHGARDGTPLLPWIRALLRDAGIGADGAVELYAFPRMLGYVFNPVSFWVCRDAAGAVRAVLCEVSNTFGEHHNYLVAAEDGGVLRSGQTLGAAKCFHVSPFCAVRGHYRFRFHFGPGRWLARVDYYDDPGQPALLRTRISGPLVALAPGGARALLWRYRWYTLGVILRIHWQALQLFVKGAPFFKKPPPPADALTRFGGRAREPDRGA